MITLDDSPQGLVARRVRLAASAASSPAVLCRLAQDEDLVVRAAAALNPCLPEEAETRLAGDPDAQVRALLAGRLASLCPDVAAHDQPVLFARLSKTLAVLLRDEISRVRLAVAAVLKDLGTAPHDIILHLARDVDMQVSEPVLRLSPVLTQDDLLELLSASPAAAAAIAGRSGLDPVLCDAVAASADKVAIRTMLENQSADVREATLDRLIQRSADVVEWHSPLVQRPVLSAKAAHSLANIVNLQLLEGLAARRDLAPSLLADLRVRLQDRLATGSEAAISFGMPIWPVEDPDEATARSYAERLQAFGRLNDEALATSARFLQKRLMVALLSVAADFPDSVVRRAVTLRSTKALISLLWQGGFSARHARAVQVLLCQIPPAAALVGNCPEGFPLRVDEMRWQLDFLVGSAPSS